MTPPRTLVAIILAILLPVAARAGDEKKQPDKNPAIKVGDTLEVTIMDLQGPGVKTTVKPVVDNNGDVKVPYVNRVAAKGLTCDKLEAAIAKAYRDAQLIHMADVSVEFAKPKKESDGL